MNFLTFHGTFKST